MQLYVLNNNFIKQSVLDEFISVIWTERYYGNNEIELIVPATPDLINRLPEGTFLSCDNGMNEVMILETSDISDGKLKLNGISLLPWMNNRFIRTSPNHEDRYFYVEGEPPGVVLWTILYNACHPDSPYLKPYIDPDTGLPDPLHLPTGIWNPADFRISGLYLVEANEDDFGWDPLKYAIPFGPVYDAMKEIATTYEVGMRLPLTSAGEDEDVDGEFGFSIGFISYVGEDRTSAQSTNPVVRFSPQMDSLTNIKELKSVATFKTDIYAFAPGLKPVEQEQPEQPEPPEEPLPPVPPIVLTTIPGRSHNWSEGGGDFGTRGLLVFADDITTDMVGTDPENVIEILNNRARSARAEHPFVRAVDGEIVPENPFKYGTDYNLGDLVELQGHSGQVQTGRVMEYIRSQDAAGERAYPTITMIPIVEEGEF